MQVLVLSSEISGIFENKEMALTILSRNNSFTIQEKVKLVFFLIIGVWLYLKDDFRQRHD